MSYVRKFPSLVYEVVPERIASPPSDSPPSVSHKSDSPLAVLTQKLDHLSRLGVDGLVLSPVFPAADPMRQHIVDFMQVDPAIGTEAELQALCVAANSRDISVIVTGGFDHVSAAHEWFVAAQQHADDDEARLPPEQRTRKYFTFGEEFEFGYACREGRAELPELDLRNAEVRRRLFTGEDSVLHHWLRLGVDGWRMSRADAVGYSILRESSRGSLTVEGDHFVIGDIKGFADRYLKDGLLDGVVNHYLREALVAYLRGQIPARQLARVMRDLSVRYGRALTRSWNVLSTCEGSRLCQALGDAARTRLGVLLAYTLPGAPHILYGDEVGICRHTSEPLPAMSWDTARWDSELFDLYVHLGVLRRARALQHGEFVDLTPEGEEEILAFARVTTDPRETVITVVNRAAQTRVRKLFAPVCDLPDGLRLRDVLAGPGAVVRSGSITLDVEGQDARILVPDDRDETGARFFRGY